MATKSKKAKAKIKKAVKLPSKLTYPKSLLSDKYPKFIKNSLVIKAFPKPEKVFPNIGLPNEEVPLTSIKADKYGIILDLIKEVGNALSLQFIGKNKCKDADFIDDLELLENSLPYDNLYDYDNIEDFMYDTLDKTKTYIKVDKGTKFATFDYNSNLEEVIKNVIAYADKNKITGGPILYLKKIDFNKKDKKVSNPFKKGNLKVCFSSDGNKGYWDIATMSMRKISSCMRWTSDHAMSLVGSIVDPYAAIIYITDGTKTKYGSAMLARAVVRFVSDHGKPAIFVEKVYKNGYAHNDDEIMRVFISYISNRVNIPVIDGSGDWDWRGSGNQEIPLSETTTAIKSLYNDDDYCSIFSYRDSGLPYMNVKKFYNPKKISTKSLDTHKNV
jgi:hypothetical protein